MMRPFTAYRANEIIQQCRFNTRHGPWSDQISRVLSTCEYDALKAFQWKWGCGHSSVARCLEALTTNPIPLTFDHYSELWNRAYYKTPSGTLIALFLDHKNRMTCYTCTPLGEPYYEASLYSFDLDNMPLSPDETDHDVGQWLLKELPHGQENSPTQDRFNAGREIQMTASKNEDFQQRMRERILETMDRVCNDYGIVEPTDADLPSLFRALDSFTSNLIIRTHARGRS